jgi:uncharacterized SAM-binding protein YcdF (DUF218 family)
MFYVSKIVWAVFQPSSIIAMVLFAGAVLTVVGRRWSGLRLLLGGAALHLVCGFSPLANWLLIPLENRVPSSAGQDIEDAAGIIVLGGAILPSPAGSAEIRLNEAAERMTEAVRLADRYPTMPVIFSGGKADLIENKDAVTEAELAAKFFENFKLVPPRLRLEDGSRNTRENAVLTAKLLQPKPDQRWILLTSAFHMPRAKALFEAQGFNVLPWPVDYRSGGPDSRWHPFSQASEGLRLMDIATKEWVGLWVLRLHGDIAWR